MVYLYHQPCPILLPISEVLWSGPLVVGCNWGRMGAHLGAWARFATARSESDGSVAARWHSAINCKSKIYYLYIY